MQRWMGMPVNHTEVEKRLWEAGDQLQANSRLKSSEYSVPVLGREQPISAVGGRSYIRMNF